ncbi:Chromo domain-containing protein [Neofusicoccum parvum]|uniref:Chromo domain-containing protein n=1 Tax=Neofusicoccum parvum TaxID=310453 RepID=A0ACB5S987_9PEZI|nr:Chromo domain-containing protein [Neofusicoccum parvum]
MPRTSGSTRSRRSSYPAKSLYTAAISEDEGGSSASDAEIPYRKPPKPAPEEDEEEGDDDEENDEEEEVYVVEKIMSHIFDEDGSIKYEIKWMGYDRKSDRTWEPEENLEGAKEALEEYFAKVGGRPTLKKRKASQTPSGTPVAKGRGRGRKPKDESISAEPEVITKPVKKEKEPEFPKGSWETHIQSVDTIEEVPDEKHGVRKRFAMVVWNTGRKTRHELAVLNQKCPQKMLAYYEQHLYFNYN